MSIKKILYDTPLIGYVLKIMVSISRLPKNNYYFIDELNKVSSDLQNTQKTLENFEKYTSENFTSSQFFNDYKLEISKRLRSLNNSVNVLNTTQSNIVKNKSSSDMGSAEYFADNHLLDAFYLDFENNFRGSEQDITNRLEVYLPEFRKIKNTRKKLSVLDIGCGRGELLQILKNNSIKCIGIDINSAMVKACKKKGLPAIEGDAIAYMNDSSIGTFSAITGFHIVEHIEFTDLLKLFSASYKALDDEGFVLFETPNPENLYVGANTFYYDPSHIKPIPPPLLKFALESVGFGDVKIIYLHPEEDNKYNENDPELARRLFGPRDYAVIARK